jgi:hypothetical protein
MASDSTLEITLLESSGNCLLIITSVDCICRLERLAEDSEGRTFELSEDQEPTVFNSTELRCIDIRMQHEEPLQYVRRRSGRGHRGSRDLYRKPMKYVIPTETESVILASCW